MTARFESRRAAYLYAQDLDNSGGSLCWSSQNLGEYYELCSSDPKHLAVLHAIDHVQNSGREWLINSESLECKVTYQGDCLIKLKPLTRDSGGRIAPVTLLFDVFGEQRHHAGRMLLDCETLMRRELSPMHKEAILRLENMTKWPKFIIALHVLFFSRRCVND